MHSIPRKKLRNTRKTISYEIAFNYIYLRVMQLLLKQIASKENHLHQIISHKRSRLRVRLSLFIQTMQS